MSFSAITLFKRLCGKNVMIQNVKHNIILRNNLTDIGKILTRGYVDEKSDVTDKKFHLVYSLKEIRIISAINSAKKPQYVITALSIPLGVGLGILDVINLDTGLAIGFTSLVLCALTTGLSKLLENTIGMLYVSDDLETIKISSVDYWGGRKDLIIPASDWVYLSDIPRGKASKYFLNTKRYSTDETLKLFCSKGVVIDKQKMSAVFGEL